VTNQDREALPITIRGVTKAYGRTKALDAVDLDIKEGEFLTLLGPSGSGKTTLLMVLAGFTRPDCGSVLFGDKEVIHMPPHLRDVGMVFQSYALFPHMTVAGNIGYPLRVRGISKDEIEKRCEWALETVQLGGYGERRVEQLSGGQKQRVALARSIVFEPQILLMDEPLSALDKKLRDHMQIELRRLHEKLGMTTVYVTHDQREALTMSDRIAVVNHGKLMQVDTPARIYDQPANRFVADFIGDSAFLPVTRSGNTASYGGTVLKIDHALPDGDLLLMIRPERLKIQSGTMSDGSNSFEGLVSDVVYQGDSFALYATLPDGQSVSLRGVIRSSTLSALPKVGAPIKLYLEREDTILISAAEA
jgi:putative spermidine/putrescine transport system ATP-binding protein